MEAQPAWGCMGPISVPSAVSPQGCQGQHSCLRKCGSAGQRGQVPWDVSPARSRGLAPTRNISLHQGPSGCILQGVFSRGRACAPTLYHHKGVRGPVLRELWEGTALLVGLQGLSGRWPGRLYLQRWAEHWQQLGLAGAVSHQRSGCSHSWGRRVSTSHPGTQKEGSAPWRARLDCSPCSSWSPALHPSSPPCSRGCTSPSRVSHPGWGLVLQAGPGVLGAAGHPGECEQGPRAVLSITLGSGSSEMDWRRSCRRGPKMELERFSLCSLLWSSLSEGRGAGFGVGGASVLWGDRDR